MQIQEHKSLLQYNTFRIACEARWYAEYRCPNDIKELLQSGMLHAEQPLWILGGGSNLLFLNDYPGLMLHPVNDAIEIIEENSDEVLVQVGAGHNWDAFVQYTVEKGWGGAENLSNIPGNVGASPVQNIGAYGVEAKDIIERVRVVSLLDGEVRELSNAACAFAYRDSVFKQAYKGRFLVDSVVYRLSKKPQLLTHYGSLQEALAQKEKPGIQDLRALIIETRSAKLPDPDKIGNGGSFFKNPVIPIEAAAELQQQFPELVSYPHSETETKLAAGWLIDQCGLKGYVNEKGTAGIHSKQALVLVNKGGASGQDIWDLAQLVMRTVMHKFGVQLEPEVIVIGESKA